ncbi:MAG: hypothetical protein JW946_01350 [Candidatus Omnitrophica bacterium]|nr:hypothetical protein [Candidatus Omnitrophota bacterium]
MIKKLSTTLAILLLTSVFSFAQTNRPIQINTGASCQKITSMLGEPVKEAVISEFWGNKKSLYKIGENDYCVIEYLFSRVKNILFLEQVTGEEALSKFNQ